MSKTVMAFGEVLWDILPDASILGGAPYNFIYRIHSLGHQGFMISRLGNDQPGKEALQTIQSLGVDTRFVQNDSYYPTGTVQITLGPDKQPQYVITKDVAYDYIDCTKDLIRSLGKADCLCFGTTSQRSTHSRQTLHRLLSIADYHNVIRFFDVNLRQDGFCPETITSSLQQADILKLNEDEANYLSQIGWGCKRPLIELARDLLAKWHLTHCAITLGDRGAMCTSFDGQITYIPGYHVAVKDPIGAGDAFSAGFVDQLLQGRSTHDCCHLGNAMGAIAATQTGATQAISAEDIRHLLASPPPRISDQRFMRYWDNEETTTTEMS